MAVSAMIVCYLIFTLIASFQISWNYFITSICKINSKGICLSFDDGPDPATTPKILEILKSNNLKAVFFVIGKKAAQYPALIQLIQENGHVIGNHSYDHNNSIGFFSSKKLIRDLEMCSETIEKIAGNKPKYFRPPFGVTNPRYQKVLKKLNLISIGWSGRSFDTVTKSKEKLLKRVDKYLSNGVILLFHDNQKITVEILPEVLERCKKKGIKIVPLQT